ncbi:NAD-dependent epimerase/dehydratase family protein [Halobellus rarus]|uniref:NAD-dependent epimerase/dehydratase family protein n=1 Tax=Halobellus rarus TaxID=1126237 RepID=A0ABD6CKT6_9EURY|nr:NAD(P)-dependent oxidoreductase [Halobellus rarus]
MDHPTVAVTGGTGRIGPTAVETLQETGYEVVNVSRSGSSEVADRNVRADATDAGDLYGALATARADAVVHLGMLSEPGGDPDHVVFESNAASTYVVLEAAEALGIDTVVLASSLSVIGGGFEPGPARIDTLPVEESHRLTPSNPYGIGKQTLEIVADGFARRADAPETIASLRFPWMPSESEMRAEFVEPDRTVSAIRDRGDFHVARNTLFSYLHRADAAALIRDCAEASFSGHERFWAAAADTTTSTPTAELVEAVYPDADANRSFEDHESLISTTKAERLVGWEPERSWRELDG